MFGLSTDVMQTCLNTLGEVARTHGRIEPGERNPDVLRGYDVELRAVDPVWHTALFGYAQWFYRPRKPRFLQCVWPGRSGRFPWEPGFEKGLERLQPELWLSPAEARNGPWRAWWHANRWPGRTHAGGLVFVSERVASEEVPVLGVEAFDDGDWAFVDGISAEPEDMMMSHLHHILERDPSLEELIDLRPGTRAWRDAPGGIWAVSPLEFDS